MGTGIARARARDSGFWTGRLVTACLAALPIADAAFITWLLIGRAHAPLLGGPLALTTLWLPAVVFWLVAIRTRFARPAALLAAAAVSGPAIGGAIAVALARLEGRVPFPSLADAAHLLFYPLMVAALILLVRGHVRGAGALALLEAAVATLGAATLLAVVLDPVIAGALSGHEGLTGLVVLAYPLLDLVLLAIIAGVLAVGTIRVGPRGWALVAGLLSFIVADVGYALLGGRGVGVAPGPLDAGWSVGLALAAWWVVVMRDTDVRPATPGRRWPRVPVSAAAVLIGLAVLIAATGPDVTVSRLAVVLAALTVGLGSAPLVFRQAMLGRMLAAQEAAVRQLIQLDQEKTDMIVTMNHEFRTPLTAINGHVELLLDGQGGELPPEAVRMLHTVERNGDRLQRLLDETLTVAMLEHAPELPEVAPVELGELAREVAAELASKAESRGVRLEVDTADDDLTVAGDRVRLERVLLNLVDNAIKFTDRAGRVVVTVGRGDAGDVVTRVRDTGIGIPPEDVGRLFSRFFRASNAKQAAVPGVGLGLSITQQIVRAHGGTIAVESAVGAGTTMIVRLPAATPES